MKCFMTLKEILYWIAFGSADEGTMEFCKKNQEKINKAKKLLQEAVNLGAVTLYGKKDIESNIEQIDLNNVVSFNLATSSVELSYPSVEIDYYEREYPVEKYNTYLEVYAFTDVVKQAFPDKEINMNIIDNNGCYRSPYLKIMQELTDELKITETEWGGKIDTIVDLAITKMNKYNVPESKRMAKNIATMIRPPQAQQGRHPNAKTKK